MAGIYVAWANVVTILGLGLNWLVRFCRMAYVCYMNKGRLPATAARWHICNCIAIPWHFRKLTHPNVHSPNISHDRDGFVSGS